MRLPTQNPPDLSRAGQTAYRSECRHCRSVPHDRSLPDFICNGAQYDETVQTSILPCTEHRRATPNRRPFLPSCPVRDRCMHLPRLSVQCQLGLVPCLILRRNRQNSICHLHRVGHGCVGRSRTTGKNCARQHNRAFAFSQSDVPDHN